MGIKFTLLSDQLVLNCQNYILTEYLSMTLVLLPQSKYEMGSKRDKSMQ